MADSPSTSAWCIVCLLYGKLALLPLLGRHLPPLYGGEPLMHGRYPSPLYGVWMVHAIAWNPIYTDFAVWNVHVILA